MNARDEFPDPMNFRSYDDAMDRIDTLTAEVRQLHMKALAMELAGEQWLADLRSLRAAVARCTVPVAATPQEAHDAMNALFDLVPADRSWEQQ